jgi:hypothetical protein
LRKRNVTLIVKCIYIKACSEHFRKCYTVLSKEVSWDIANTECIKRNEHLVTVTSRNEMNYVQYLLRSRLYQQNRTEENEAADKQKFLRAHIGISSLFPTECDSLIVYLSHSTYNNRACAHYAYGLLS